MSKNASPRWTAEQLAEFNRNRTKQLIDKNRAATQPLPKRNPFDQPVQKNTDLFGKAVPAKQAKAKKAKRIPRPSAEKDWMHSQLTIIADKNGLKLTQERWFAKEIGKRWRFDWDLTYEKEGRMMKVCAIEYEGLFAGRKGDTGKSGHLTVDGYTDNCKKYNQAAMFGWRVMRYTPKHFKQMVQDILYIISKLKR